MRWLCTLLLLGMVLHSARADAQDPGPPDITEGSGPSLYFPQNNPDAPKPAPQNTDMPHVEQGWLDWLYNWMHWIWELFMLVWHYCVEVPADWLRGLIKGWFCWVAVGLIEFIGHILRLEEWHDSLTVSTIRQGLQYFREQAGFIGRVFPFTLWAGLAGLYLSIESALAAVKWIIGIIPGT